MYNKIMKKLSVILLVMVLFSCAQVPTQASAWTNYQTKIAQNKIYKAKSAELKALFGEQIKQANKHCLTGLASVYSKDFVNSDGFGYDIFIKMVEETWKTYPDITYTSEINSIETDGNYARVYLTETAVAAPKEIIGDFETVGELYSISKCVYHLEKHGNNWFITSEDVLEETSTLKYGRARFVDVKLITPKQIGAGRYYTSSLKLDLPEGFGAVGSISQEKIVYPQTKTEDNFRRVPNDNTLERVFKSNSDNVNEYSMASVGIAHAIRDKEDLKVYMDGLAFIMTRVNVIPENKFVNDKAEQKEKKNEQSK